MAESLEAALHLQLMLHKFQFLLKMFQQLLSYSPLTLSWLAVSYLDSAMST